MRRIAEGERCIGHEGAVLNHCAAVGLSSCQSPTTLGRSVPLLFDGLPLTDNSRGEPEAMLTIGLTLQPPRTAFVTPAQFSPTARPLPIGNS